MQVSVVPAELGHIKELAKRAIAADQQEILALGLTVEYGLLTTWGRSEEAFAALADDELALCFGVIRATELSDEFYPWLISTDLIFRHPKRFMAGSKQVVDQMLSCYPVLSNWVDARHTRAIRWLRWLGAEIGPAEPHGPYLRPFHKFTLRASNVH